MRQARDEPPRTFDEPARPACARRPWFEKCTTGGMTTSKQTNHRSGPEVDEALAAEARGVAPTSDDAEVLENDNENDTETEATGKAAGLHAPRGKPLRGVDEVTDRDLHRWENDPASAEDATTRPKTD